jgi:hypothetical protein
MRIPVKIPHLIVVSLSRTKFKGTRFKCFLPRELSKIKIILEGSGLKKPKIVSDLKDCPVSENSFLLFFTVKTE